MTTRPIYSIRLLKCMGKKKNGRTPILIFRLLGQTWESKMFAEKSSDAFKLLDGFEDDYRIRSNDIFGDDFTYNMFQNL